MHIETYINAFVVTSRIECTKSRRWENSKIFNFRRVMRFPTHFFLFFDRKRTVEWTMAATTTSQKVRRWCFTLNNYSEEDEAQLQALASTASVNYMVYGREEAPTTGTPHLQGYVVFSTPKRLSGILALNLNSTAHWEKAFSAETSCINYCKKDGDFYEKENRRQGKRTDLEQAAETTLSLGVRQAALDHPSTFVKYHKGLQALREITFEAPPVTQKKDVIWIYGNTGLGKTKWVYDNFPRQDIWHQWTDRQWYNGYEYHKVALLDDLRSGDMKYTTLLQILDRYPIRVPIKGDYRHWCPETVIITSDRSPLSFEHGDEDPRQLTRRITKVMHFHGPDIWEDETSVYCDNDTN